jgi:SAM-dependent methyltransferase
MIVARLSNSRRGLLALALALVLAGVSAAAHGYEPRVGQAGKDVVWVPTPDSLVTRMLTLAAVTPDDYVVDLGSGDGRIVIAAVRDFNARALGIEYNPDLVALSRLNASEAGVDEERGRFIRGDIFEEDFSDATVVTMYLLPRLNLRLRHILMAMKPGTRLVSHQFTMGRWEPDETSTVDERQGYLWIVPANAGGDWRLSYPDGGSELEVDLSIEQTFQRIEGRISFGEMSTTLRSPHLQGTEIAFGFTGADGQLRQFMGAVDGDRMKGTVSWASGSAEFSAKREGDAPPIRGSRQVSESRLDDESGIPRY